MVILSYGISTWNDFINAYKANKVIYCRASSESNPSTGNQTRMAFLAFVNNPNVASMNQAEFQYYRSVSSHGYNTQGDEVFIYTLKPDYGGTWTNGKRNAYTKIEPSTGLDYSYSSNKMTITVKNSDIVNLVYPVGSIYTSVNSTSPGTLFGGTWEQLKDQILLGAGDTYTAGDTGNVSTGSAPPYLVVYMWKRTA